MTLRINGDGTDARSLEWGDLRRQAQRAYTAGVAVGRTQFSGPMLRSVTDEIAHQRQLEAHAPGTVARSFYAGIIDALVVRSMEERFS